MVRAGQTCARVLAALPQAGRCIPSSDREAAAEVPSSPGSRLASLAARGGGVQPPRPGRGDNRLPPGSRVLAVPGVCRRSARRAVLARAVGVPHLHREHLRGPGRRGSVGADGAHRPWRSARAAGGHADARSGERRPAGRDSFLVTLPALPCASRLVVADFLGKRRVGFLFSQVRALLSRHWPRALLPSRS
jgi:hypothetical protein